MGHLTGFWIVAGAYLTLAAFGTAPTPLWPGYERADHFGPLTVTVAFATMVIGIAVSLILFGHLSDRLGRRRILVPALAVGLIAAVVLVLASSLAGLLIGRLLTGVAIGLMAATATAYLNDLYRAARPTVPASGLPSIVAGVAGLGGLALGPLIAGSVAEVTNRPLSVSYIPFGVLMLVFLILALVTPETIDRLAVTDERPARFSLTTGSRRAFVMASCVGFLAFGVSGLFSSLGAIIIREQLGLSSVFVGGMGTFATFAASALSQILLRDLTTRSMLSIGALLFPAGLALTVASLVHPALWLFLLAATVAGAGLLFKAGLGEAARSAAPGSRAGVLAMFFVISYVGLGVPSVLFAVTLQYVDLLTTMIWFACVLAALTIALAVVGVRSGRSTTAGTAP